MILLVAWHACVRRRCGECALSVGCMIWGQWHGTEAPPPIATPPDADKAVTKPTSRAAGFFFCACESQVASRRGVTPRAGRTARHAGRTPDALMVSWTRTTPRGQGAPPADELTRWALLPRRAHPQPPGSRAHTAHGAMPGSPRGPRG